MATVVDQQPIFKHFCRICKKGFGCGRALGGHMRAHGIGDENGHIEDEDPACSDWDDKLAGGGNNNQPPGNKRMYALRTNPNRLKSCRICENCGKEFVSWKSFLEHGKCSSADANDQSLVSSPTGSDYEEDGAAAMKRDYAWSKGKRSRRAKTMGTSISNCPSSEEEDLAHCLVLLSAARVDPLIAETEESCASASKEEDQRRNPVINAMLPSINIRDKAKGVANKGLFECKACKKVFNSHQALGGHRASHKKVKGCFAANIDDLDDSIMDEDVITNDELTIFSKSTAILQLEHASHHQSQMAMAPKRKSKVHECSICHRIFSSGQALGGHKRCHWLTSNSPDTSSIARFHQFQDHQSQHFHQRSKLNRSETLDLNLPAPLDDTAARVRQDHENTLSFQVPTEIFLQPWIGVHANDENNDAITNNNKKNIINSSIQNSLDDEAESKVKLAKLSDLKDMNLGSGSSPWLQVGIGSTSNMGSDP